MAALPAAIARVYAECTTCGTGERTRWWAEAATRVAGHLATAVRTVRFGPCADTDCGYQYATWCG